MTKIAQVTKTASKVGLFITGTIVTGGGSLSALGASGWSLAQAGGCIVGGADCIVDIANHFGKQYHFRRKPPGYCGL